MSVLQMSFSASVLILAVMLVRTLVFRRLPKKFLMVFWGMVLLRLLISFYVPIGYLGASSDSLHSPSSEYEVHSSIGENTNITSDETYYLGVEAIASFLIVPEFVRTLSAMVSNILSDAVRRPLFFVIWNFGVVALALIFLITHFRRRKEYKASLPIRHSFICKWLNEQNIKRNVQVRISDRVNAPLTYGVWKPIILLPKNTDFNDETKLMHILTHEITHIKRFDVLIKWLLVIALCVHWFNPLVWVMYMLANRDIEFSCDESVVRTFGIGAKSTYALNLIGLEENKCINPTLAASFARKPLEKRIIAIMNIKKASAFGVVLAVFLILGIGVIMVVTSVYNGASNYYEMITINYAYEQDDDIATTIYEYEDNFEIIISNKQYDGMNELSSSSSITTTTVFCCYAPRNTTFFVPNNCNYMQALYDGFCCGYAY
ncbi:MAG: M56 family metallopeptidase [Oscillospiraceae bacterium]|nr:M56 family metallopeptidase [Oscillospiraceae bacterium]